MNPTRCVLPLLLSVTAAARAADPVPETRPSAPLSVARLLSDRPDERIAVLSNGLTVILREHRTAPVVSVRMYCRTGSIYEQEYAGAGISHLFEHLLHAGETRHRTEEQSEQTLAELGDNTNAFTSYATTCYFINTSKDKLTTAIDLLSDWITNPTFPDGPFRREWGVVQRELERDLDDPVRQLHEMTQATMYLHHPVRFPIIGHKQAVQSLTKQDIVNYYRRMYVPDRIVVAIAGDLNLDEALQAVSRAFAGFEQKPVKPITLPEEPPVTTPRQAIRRMDVDAALVRLAWPSIRLTDPDLYALDLLSFILTEGQSSRLVRSIVHEGQLAFAVDSYSWTPEWARGLFVITARLDPARVSPAIAAIWTEIRKLQEDPVSDEELAKAKRQKTAEHVFSHQTAEQIADSMASDFIATGDAHFSANYTQRIQDVTKEQVRDAARKYLRPESTGTIMVLPRDRHTPAEQPAPAPTLPARLIRLDNGLRILLRKDPSSPLVSIRAYCLAGLVCEDEANNGIANMMARLMLRGTRTRTADEIAHFFDSRGASIEAAGGENTVYVCCEVLRDDVAEAMEVFADVVLNPTFPALEVDRLRPQILDAISRIDEQWRSDLEAYFRRVFYRNSPYRMLPVGRAESVRRIDSAALADYHRRHLVAPNVVLAIFGDIDETSAEEQARRLFAALPDGPVPTPPVRAEPPIDRPALYIRKAPPDRGAAGIYAGFRGTVIANTRDRWPLAVLDTIMSGYGYPGGWLHESLRGGDRDLVYEVHAMNVIGVAPGHFGMYAACQPEKIAEVYRVFEQAVQKARAGQFTEEELRRAKGIILTTDLMQSQTNAERAAQAALDELYGLGFDFRQDLERHISSVTMEDVRRVARQYLTQPIIAVVTPKPEAVDLGVEPTAIDSATTSSPRPDATPQ